MPAPPRLREDPRALDALGLHPADLDAATALAPWDAAAARSRFDAAVAAGAPTPAGLRGGGGLSAAAKAMLGLGALALVGGGAWLAAGGAETAELALPIAEGAAIETWLAPAAAPAAPDWPPAPSPSEPSEPSEPEPQVADPVPYPATPEPEPDRAAGASPESAPAAATRVAAASAPARPARRAARGVGATTAVDGPEPLAERSSGATAAAAPAEAQVPEPEPDDADPELPPDAPSAPEAGDLAAQLAAYEAGRVAVREGRWAAAARAFADYRARWPRGDLAAEAGVGRLEALVALGRHGAAAGLAQQLVSSGQAGRRRAEILRVRAESLAKLGRCDAAESAFSRATGAGAALKADVVLSALRHCRQSSPSAQEPGE